MNAATKTTSLVLLLLAAALSAPVIADPPAHAPAHGWRKKNDRHYVGYTGARWEHDYDIRSGTCNREAIATAVGGLVGGAIAARVAEPENRTVATLIGAAAGALIGKKIGGRLDEADAACVGHALEVAESGQRISWTNDAAGVRYALTPGADVERAGATCRRFTLVTDGRYERSSRAGMACPTEAGVWQLVQ